MLEKLSNERKKKKKTNNNMWLGLVSDFQISSTHVKLVYNTKILKKKKPCQKKKTSWIIKTFFLVQVLDFFRKLTAYNFDIKTDIIHSVSKKRSTIVSNFYGSIQQNLGNCIKTIIKSIQAYLWQHFFFAFFYSVWEQKLITIISQILHYKWTW